MNKNIKLGYFLKVKKSLFPSGVLSRKKWRKIDR